MDLLLGEHKKGTHKTMLTHPAANVELDLLLGGLLAQEVLQDGDRRDVV
jgi:hypothetical protein